MRLNRNPPLSCVLPVAMEANLRQQRFYKEAHLTILYEYLTHGTEHGAWWYSYPQPAPAPPVTVVLLREPSLVPLSVDNQAL